MEQETREALRALEQKIDAVYVSSEKTRKYFQWMLIVAVVTFVLPLIGLFFAVPTFLSQYSSVLGGETLQGL